MERRRCLQACTAPNFVEDFIAKDRNPLVPDFQDFERAEFYLSPKYTQSDSHLLKCLGTKPLQWSKFLDRLELDVRNPSGSKWQSMNENADWRTQICKLLSRAYTNNLENQRMRMRTLTLIPLHDDRWVSAASRAKVYFSETCDIPIPVDIGVDLVCSVTAENAAWSDLLSILGVTSCPQDSAINLINRVYTASNHDIWRLSNAVAHIRCLYWFLPKETTVLAPQVRFINQYGSLIKKDQYLYFPCDVDEYSPSNLFKQDSQKSGHPVAYLHKEYINAVGSEVVHYGRSWMKWLEEVARVRRIPELRARKHDRLSKDFLYIISYQSDRLLGLLKCEWAAYRPQFTDAAPKELRNGNVVLENGAEAPMQHTYLPFPKLKKITVEPRIGNAYPFFAQSEPLLEEEAFHWTFAKDLQIGMEESLDFYIRALDTFKKIQSLTQGFFISRASS